MTAHILHSFDASINNIMQQLQNMALTTQVQLHNSTQCLTQKDQQLATHVINNDATVDAMQTQLEQLCITTIALQQPMAQDLRFLVSMIKIAHSLERCSDYAKNNARQLLDVQEQHALLLPPLLTQMSNHAIQQLENSIHSLINQDSDLAETVLIQDMRLDQMCLDSFKKLHGQIIVNNLLLPTVTNWMFICKNLERVGDHATNIAECVLYTLTGELPRLGSGNPRNNQG
jgi:phosphate transport system protein